MFYKKMTAGVLCAMAISLSATFSLAATGNGSGCFYNEAATGLQTPVNQAQNQAKLKNALDTLVKEGTISQEQEDAVIKAFEAKRAQFEKERQELKKNHKELKKEGPHKGKRGKEDNALKKRQGVLKDLVEDGTITMEQADAIKRAIRSVHDSLKKPE